ncbi:MAG: hypothetical protein LBE04_07905 [Prevotellaceae bacterium]|nr:hypothetical protein [Prevotellaceae bacterium]
MPLDEIRRIKIPHETAIPTGVYKVVVNMSPAKKHLDDCKICVKSGCLGLQIFHDIS